MKLSLEDQVQAAIAARRFYLEGSSKSDIAAQLGVSRFRVARLLDAAREHGIVTFSVQLPSHVEPVVSDRLRRAWGLRRAIAVETSSEPDELRDGLGAVAAALLADLVQEKDHVGIAWGRTLRAVVEHLEPGSLSAVPVTQLTGAAGSADDNCIDLVRQVAAVTGGTSHAIFAPLLLPDPATLAGVKRQSSVARALAQHSRLTIALLAVGTWPADSQLMALMPASVRRRLVEEGVHAEIAGTLLDRDGVELRSLEGQLLSIDSDLLRKVPEVVVVAGGVHKASAIRAVLTAGFGSTLITDTQTARLLLDQGPFDPDGPPADAPSDLSEAVTGARAAALGHPGDRA